MKFVPFVVPLLGKLGAVLVLTASIADAQLTLPSYYGNYPPVPAAGQWSSTNVFYSGGKLTYYSDGESNRIPDFSYAGYHYGEKALPNVAVVNTLAPEPGDQTSRIQNALNAIGALPMDANGHRGTLLLLPGTWEIWGTVRVQHNGVVLRGSGNGTNPAVDTILWGRGNSPHQRTVVIVGSNSGNPWGLGTAVNITNQFVQVGSMSVSVANAASFSVGQHVQIRHPSSQAWIDAVDGGGMVSDADWTAGSKELRWIRRVTRIDGTRIFLDAPIYNHLDRSLVQATIIPITSRNLITEAGVENLRVDIETLGGEDENHAWNAVGVVGADNCWVQNVNARYFGYAAVRTSGAIRITVKNCQGTDPVAIRTGGRMYHFVTDSYSQLVLFTGCHASGARHSFISNGTTTVGGAVWHRCTMIGGDFEAHRHWSQGMLLDNGRELGSANSQAKLINRGDFGTSHGWGAAHSVIWKFNKETTVQKPPTAQNWSVTTEGTLRNSVWFPGPFGSRERNTTGTLVPESLYEAQLCDRLAQRPHFIIARHSGKAILVDSASGADGASIIQGITNSLGTHGEWFVAGIGAGYNRITARHSSKDLTIEGASVSDGANAVQNPYSGSAPANDEWQLVLVTNDFYRIVNRHSGKVLGVAGASTADGVLLQQMTWTGDTHQQFRFQARPEVLAVPPALQISALPASQIILPGSNALYTVSIAATSVVSLAVSGLPADSSGGFEPTTVTNNGSSVLTVATAANTPIGNYVLTITGTTAVATNQTTVSLSVQTNLQAAPGFLNWVATAVDDNTWGNFLNWSNGTGFGSPGPANYLLFGNAGAAGTAEEVTSVLEGDLTIGSLVFTNTTGFHRVSIAPGRTLTIISNSPGYQNAPAINVGMETHGTSSDIVQAAIEGEDGTLALDGAGYNIQIRQGFGSGTVATYAELDLSGLGTFTANINRIQVGAESGAPRRTSGTLRLARVNQITLNQALSVNTNFTSGSPALYLGHNTQAGNSRGSSVYLGFENAINVNYVVIGRGNQTGNLLAFDPAVLDQEPTATFRASDGLSRIGLWVVGDNSPGSLTAPSSGTNDFSGGVVDILVDRMFLGRGRVGTTANTGFGTLTFDAGTVNANILRLGTMVDEITSTNASGVGVANVNGDAILLVNDVLDLAHTNIYALSAPSAVANTHGTLNVNGGTAVLNSVVAGGGTSIVNLTGGEVLLGTTMGRPNAPLTQVNLTNATLHLKVNGSPVVTNIVAVALSVGGSNTLVLDFVAPPNGAQVFPLAGYGSFSGSTAGFVLENVPVGFVAEVIHNVTDQRLDLAIAPAPVVFPVIGSVRLNGAGLVMSGSNGLSDAAFNVLGSTNLTLPLDQWSIVGGGVFDENGGFSWTNSVDAGSPQQFFLLQVP